MLEAVGLQSIWLFWRVLPLGIKTQFVAFLTQLTNSQHTPWAFWGVLLLPYLILMVSVAQWLYRKRKFQLARFGENLALGLESVLTVISFVNPFWRSLNLFVSTLTLGWITWKYISAENSRRVYRQASAVEQQGNPAILVPLTHIIGLCAIASAIDLFLPNQALNIWSAILLIFMATEWVFFVWMKAANYRENSAFFPLVSCMVSKFLVSGLSISRIQLYIVAKLFNCGYCHSSPSVEFALAGDSFGFDCCC